MFEYGGGVSEGPAGQVGGSGGRGGADLDWGGQLVDRASDTIQAIAALPTEQFLLLIAGLIIGLWVLRRAL